MTSIFLLTWCKELYDEILRCMEINPVTQFKLVSNLIDQILIVSS